MHQFFFDPSLISELLSFEWLTAHWKIWGPQVLILSRCTNAIDTKGVFEMLSL